MPFRDSIKLSFAKHMKIFREKFKAIFNTRNASTVVTLEVEPQNSANSDNTQYYDGGSSRQLPGHLIIGGSAQEKDLENIVTNPLNDNGITQYFDSALMAQLPDRFAIGGVGMHSIEQSDIQVTNASENDFNGLPVKLFVDGDDNQDIYTVEIQVPGGHENVNLEPTVSSGAGNYGYLALGCVRSSSYSGGSSGSPGQDVIEIRRLSYHPYQSVPRSLTAVGKSNCSLADSEDLLLNLIFKPGQNSEVLGFKEHSAAYIASIAVIAKYRTVSASNSLGSGDRVSICSQRDLSSETTLLPQDSATTMPNSKSSSSNTVNHVNSSGVTIQDAGSDTVSKCSYTTSQIIQNRDLTRFVKVGSSFSTVTSDTCDTAAKVKVDDHVSRALRSSVEELRQHYLNGHLNSPEPYSYIRGNKFMEGARRRENGGIPIDYSGQVGIMNESNREATTIDTTEDTHSG